MNDQVLETKDEIAAVENGHIVAFSFVESALSDLKVKFGDVAKFDVSTAPALKATKQELSELASYRINLEKKRKELKEPILARGKLLDEEAKRIAAKLAELEDPISAKVKAEEKRLADIKAEEDRKEALRVEALERRLSEIREYPLQLLGKPLIALRAGRISLGSIDPESFEKFSESASLYKQVALEKMDRMIDTAEQAEVQAKINEENARVAAAEKADQQRIYDVKAEIARLENYSLSLVRCSSALLKTELEFIKNKSSLDCEFFGEFIDDAAVAVENSIKQISEMIVSAEEKENQAKELAAARLQQQKDQEELAKLRYDAAKAEEDRIDRETKTAEVYAEAKTEDEPNPAEKSDLNDLCPHKDFTKADEENFNKVFSPLDAPLTRDEIIDIVAAYIGIAREEAEQQIINAFN